MTKTTTKRGGLVVVAMTALMLLAVGCGGSSKSSTSSSDSKETTTTTAKSSGSSGGGGSIANCLDLQSKFENASKKIDDITSSANFDYSDIYKTMDSLTSSMPSAIKGDWSTVVEYFKKLSDAMKGVDMNNIANDPTAMSNMVNAMQGLDDAKYTTAINNIEAFFTQKCPGLN